jgi:hypothetical protein
LRTCSRSAADSAARHVHRAAVLPLPVPLRRTPVVVFATSPSRCEHHSRQGTRLRTVRGCLPLRSDREDARGAQGVPVLRALFRILPQRRTAREIEADPGIGDRAAV